MKIVFGIVSSQDLLIKINFPILINQLRNKKITWKNETWVDSGGYQIALYNLKISVKDVLEKYKTYNAYAFFSLDIPSIFSPLDRKNFEYFEYLYTKMEYIERIIPVIHLYPTREVDEAIDFYSQYTDYIAFGGIIASSKLKILIYTFPWYYYIRKYVKRLHVLGMSAPYFLQIFDTANSMDTTTYTKTASYREIFWFDGTRRYVGDRKERTLTKEEEEKLFEFLDKTNFPFEYDFSNVKILKTMNAWILKYNNWNIKNKYTIYAEKLRKMGLDSLVTEIIQNYKIANELKKEKQQNKKKNSIELEE
ncbi:queuine tRNA-ribosyltransferase [Sulfolobus islandicus rod-shaped virus 1]|uniref:Uncharacterized protein 306 n=1 Tax=Sulfolobus islandicus rod-shaped virus 1 TaxID=157898 RepID=Y306_SIRV1|nr:queuine tRNA-ribosyltransferase [Sulfolobus islandicus rod-shaped virus 1]Q8QL48.1 RecName: Full=Uncharacterized protein 306 [Sulfolobus islandicus rod-shaped virus 1]CAC93961.1 hypothetical protein [Sulfolobus islandicus rod-shaped virus 1]